MDTDGELMKPVLWSQLRALSLSLSQHYCFTRQLLNAKGKLLLSFFLFQLIVLPDSSEIDLF
jgi:hypothetical protein